MALLLPLPLQAIDAIGREIALRRGCNILMPILTPTKYREHYTLYEGKPCISDTADECQKVRRHACTSGVPGLCLEVSGLEAPNDRANFKTL